jgi:hypothetical protein
VEQLYLSVKISAKRLWIVGISVLKFVIMEAVNALRRLKLNADVERKKSAQFVVERHYA